MFNCFGNIINNIPDEICRPAKKCLLAQSVSPGIQTKVTQYTNVVHGPVSFNKIIVYIGNQIIIYVDRYKHAILIHNPFHRVPVRMAVLRISIRYTIRCMIYTVMKIRNVVMADYMAGTTYLDCIFRQTFFIWIGSLKRWQFLIRIRRYFRWKEPAVNSIRIVSADKNIISDVKIL